MHPGYRSPDAMGPSGPIDPSLSVISIRSTSKRPIALFANFSMHYYGDKDLSADYYGLFASRIKQKIVDGKRPTDAPEFVGVMSHGCSGDIYLRDYLKPAPKTPPHNISTYSDAIVGIAYKTYQAIDNYRSDATLDMAQAELPLKYRTPDKQRLEWAQRIVSKTKGLPQSTEDVYAREQLILHKLQQTKVVLQAIRIGEIGLTGMPNEVYALTGLKVKAMSPLKHTVTVDLANGADGYIPPPEQHFLGGYNTWAARSAGLEVQAEPKIVETVMQLLERVAKRHRRTPRLPLGPASTALINTKPAAYWRLNEFQMPHAIDRMGRYDGMFEMGVAFYLKGPHSPTYNGPGVVNRSVHFAGGRLRSRIRSLKSDYSFSGWLWNGMPNDARAFGGHLFSRGHDQSPDGLAEHLGIGGSSGNTGNIVFVANGKSYAGKSVIPRWTWTHVTCSRTAGHVSVYVNGQLEIDAQVRTRVSHIPQVFVGGRNDNRDNFEGRLDEVAIWTRAISKEEATAIYRAAQPQE